MNRRPMVVYWNNIPSPYVVGRFNALADRDNLAFEAWFNSEREPDRSWQVNEDSWRFSGRYLRPAALPGSRLTIPVRELATTRPDLLVSLYASASFALGSFVAKALGSRVAFRVLPTFDSWTPRSFWKESLKRFLFRSVDGVKVPGPAGAVMASRYGVPMERIHTVTQTIDVAHYGQALAMTAEARTRQRDRLGLEGCVFAYVGRLWSGKGLDYLFDAYDLARRERNDLSLLIIGDGIDEERYRHRARSLPNVTFTGFVQPSDLPRYYALADVSVLPTLGDPYGLVVEEAMAAGLPVICTEAAGDIYHRLPDGRAGVIVPPASATSLAKAMTRLTAEPVLRASMGREALRLAQQHGHERWAEEFETLVDRVLTAPPQRAPQARFARALGIPLLATKALFAHGDG